MKHLLLFFSSLILCVGFSFGQVLSEDFSGGALPAGWTAASVSAGDAWEYGGSLDFGAAATINDPSGNLGEYAHIDISDDPDTTSIITPVVNIGAYTTPILSFQYITQTTSTAFNPYNRLIVDYWDGTTWVNFDVIDSLTTLGWTYYEYDISTFTFGVNDVQFRFSAQEGGAAIGGTGTLTYDQDMALDEVFVMEAPTCPQPSFLAASAVTATTADVSWQENGTATLWNIEYGPASFTPGIGAGTAITGTSNNPESLSGLTPSTNYEFYVQADCGGGDLSLWVGPFDFTTLCAPFMAPWTDDVESLTPVQGFTSELCWDATAPGVYDWNITGTGTTPSAGTGPNVANSGTNFFYIEASTTTIGPAELTTPQIDVTALTLPMLEFYYHMHGVVTGDLAVEAWDGATWNVVDNISGEQQAAQTDPWLRREIILTGYTGVIQIRFVATGSGSTQYGDISIDDVSILEAPTCPAPSAFMVTASDLSSADFAWTSTGSETEWQLEYGAPGFTPDMQLGTSVLTPNNPETISGLTANSFYEVYLQAVCSPGDTSNLVGPISFNTYNQGQYMDWNSDCPTAGFIDISTTGQDLLLTDDGEVGIATLPFPILFQGVLMTSMTVGNNGGLQLGTTTAAINYGGNFNTLGDGTMFPWGDDLDDETGDVYIEQVGTSPNSVLVIQWDNSNNFSNGIGTVTFQIQIDEATGEIFYVYDDVEFGGANIGDDFGANADIGISGPNQDITVSTNDPQYLTDNSCVHFYYTNCPAPQNYSVVYTTNDEAAITWAAGLAGETDWTVIYGPEGFDPLTGGTSINTTSPAAIFPGLDDITTYDVYIYADCNPGVLQSIESFGQFTTLPNCSDPTALNAASATDSIFTDWSWVESSGIGTYASTGFNTQYGMLGFGLYDGSETIVNADNNFTDTTEDMTLLGGGVYEVYVQAVCGTDTSNWVGPVEFVMPLTNDSTCNAIDLMVDGSVYVFNNSTASTQLNENTLAPPTTGFQTTDGWGESGIQNSTWFTFTAPASGQMALVGTDVVLDGQMAVYETTDCANVNAFTFIGGNDDQIDGTSAAPDFTLCGLTPGNQYYLMYDGYLGANGNYSIALSEIVVEAGTSNGVINVCTGDTSDLFTGISGYDMGGTWTQEIATIGFTGSTFPSAGLAYQVYNFEYEVVHGCAYDTIIQQVQIYGPSNAGVDGSMTVCQNEPINLLAGLGGNVDLGGTWYDPSNNALPSGSITASNIPGQFNYDYITSNGVCPEDTANVVVNVDAGCNYLNLQEAYFGTMDIYPNPTSGMIYIANNGSTETFDYELTDVNGKVMATAESAINGTELTEINLADYEPGIYMIKVSNDNAAKTFRIVKQ